MSKIPSGNSPSQASATWILTWIGYFSEYHITKVNYESENSERQSSSEKRYPLVGSQNGLGCCSSWFKFVVSGKQDLQSLIDPIGQTRHFVLIETEKNPLEFANVIKTWITCCTYTRGIQNFLFILLRKRDFGPVRLSRVTMMHFFSPTKILFFPQSNFHPLFLNEDGRIRGKRHSKLHYRFRRYSTLSSFAWISISAKLDRMHDAEPAVG